MTKTQKRRAPATARTRGPQEDLAPWVASANDPWDRRKAKHLLRRAGFGARPTEIDGMLQLGMDRSVDLLLATDTATLQPRGFRVLPSGEVLNLQGYIAQRAQWLWECAYTQYPLKEKMAVFWHNHFSVGQAGAFDELMTDHVNVFRRLGMGSYRDLLIAVTKDPAMMYFLDQRINGLRGSNGPTVNENYGRELLELYSMGEGNGYSQEDVRAAAECLTGWGLFGYQTYTFRQIWHKSGSKAVLGQVIFNRNIGTEGEQDGYDLIDAILAHPSTAKYVATKIWEYFVAEDPDPALIDLLAQTWRDSEYDIRSLLNVILRSNYFYSDSAVRHLVKSPADVVVGAIRNLNLPHIGLMWAAGSVVEKMGLPLLNYQTPEGVEHGGAWLNSLGLIQRVNFASKLTQNAVPQNQPGAGIGANFQPIREVQRANLQSAEEIVDHYLELLVDNDVPSQVRDDLLFYMNNDDNGPRPFQMTPAMINTKVKGLVRLILSLPEYSIL